MTALRVCLTIGMLVEEIDDAGNPVIEPNNRVKTSVARFSEQADLEQYLPVMLDRLGDDMRTLATVHPRRGTPQERAMAARRSLLHKLAQALDLPAHLMISDPFDNLAEQHPHQPAVCPMDGHPLRTMTAQSNGPSTYQHTDGTIHDDLLNTIHTPREEHP